METLIFSSQEHPRTITANHARFQDDHVDADSRGNLYFFWIHCNVSNHPTMSIDLPLVDFGRKDKNCVAPSQISSSSNGEESGASMPVIPEKHYNLSVREIWNLSFCFLAWACNVSIVTLGKTEPFFVNIGFKAFIVSHTMYLFNFFISDWYK